MFSFQIGKPFGIPLRVHGTLLLFVLLAAISVGSLSLAIALSVAVFASVAVHELGHALVARRLGVRVIDIILHPLGGLARLGGIPRSARKEFLIAAAGPLVSLVLAGIFFGLAVSVGQIAPFLKLMLGLFWKVNLLLGLFNLLPAFPLDGGRIFRAWRATKTTHLQATRTAVKVSRVVAIGLGVAGLLYNPWLILIAVFVWITASAELKMTELKDWIGGGTGMGGFTRPEPKPAERHESEETREITLSPGKEDGVWRAGSGDHAFYRRP